MSAIPSRTRSLRKPGDNITSRYERPVSKAIGTSGQLADSNGSQNGSKSPSRLPTVRTSRPASISSRPPSVSSMRPPMHKPSLSKPTASGLQRSRSNRISNVSISTSTTTEPTKQDRSQPLITTSRHIRNPSTSSISLAASTRNPAPKQGHTRTKSSSTLLTSSTILRPPARAADDGLPPPRASMRAPPAEAPQLKKPAFATYQQHFSPAKNPGPKPLTAAYLAPPSPSKLPANIAISAETAKLQNELLQLHILHQNAESVGNEWRASAKQKLGERFQGVVRENEELVELERDGIERENAVALLSWGEVGHLGGVGEKVQILDEIVTGVWNLGESGGKYARIVRRFERWLNCCRSILDSREADEVHGDIMFIEEMDQTWKGDCQMLERKLEGWRDYLRDLGKPDGKSSLAATIEGYGSMIRGMLMELSTMAQIERDAMASEAELIKSANCDDDDDTNIPTAGAVWRST
ncbi:hypothetical protein BJ878DRAFT_37355 [Calycina marina]|uniref:AGA1 A-agglutinin anchor subunit n=1 Tax=Calycina marina TaxID=1763456 RepID=A0A9P8CFF0_9HELO|nr:hypothetical protein BJ878DRAFT_37355 [Calycina marina]